jgi:hypothetical protein
MMRKLFNRFDAMAHRHTAYVNRLMDVETFGSLMIIVCFFASVWAIAWYAHIVFPWLENLLGLGPYDIDSERKIQWRRIWSSAVCLPGIIASIGLYIRNKRMR